MLRFMACAWDAEDLAQQSEVRTLQFRTLRQSHWRVVLDVPGLVVMCAGLLDRAVECYEIPDQSGVILGKLFSRRSADADGNLRVVLNQDAGKRIVQSGGRYLVGNYWGEYVAFLRDSARKATFVLQGPSAGRSVYRTLLGGAHVYFSSLQTLREMRRRAICKLGLRGVHGCAVPEIGRKPGLRDVKALMGGQCDEIGGIGLVTHSYWSPVTFALSVRRDVEDCVRELGAVVRRTVHGWAGSHDRILHRLSGGLDSSIVLACLANAPTHPQVTCITYYGRDIGTDERQFARLAAQSAGCQLIEIPLLEGSRIDDWDSVSLCPTPQGCFIAVQEPRGDKHRARSRSNRNDDRQWRGRGFLSAAERPNRCRLRAQRGIGTLAATGHCRLCCAHGDFRRRCSVVSIARPMARKAKPRQPSEEC